MKVVVEADRRRCAVESAAEAERVLRAGRRRLAGLEVDLGKALAEIERKRSYLAAGRRSAQGWAEAAGYGPREVRRLLELGRAIAAAPELEERVRAGAITPESAAQVGHVLADDAVRRAGVDVTTWIARAESLPPRALREAATRAIEQANQREMTVPLRLRVTRSARDGFRRARVLLSRGRRRLLTEGEAFGRVVEEFLAGYDPARRALPRRVAAFTGGGGRNRRIPARVLAELERRSRGLCEICGIRRAVERMHLRVPHARGGSRELDNLADACHACHLLADAGYFEFSHFDEAKRPVWKAHPERLGRLRERPPPYAGACGRQSRRVAGRRALGWSPAGRRITMAREGEHPCKSEDSPTASHTST